MKTWNAGKLHRRAGGEDLSFPVYLIPGTGIGAKNCPVSGPEWSPRMAHSGDRPSRGGSTQVTDRGDSGDGARESVPVRVSHPAYE